MAAPVVRVLVELVDHDHDHWCRTCLLGTGVRFVYAVRTDERLTLQGKLICVECGGTDVEVNPDPRHC